MKEIKFKAKRVDNDEWVVGSLVQSIADKWAGIRVQLEPCSILDFEEFNIHPETICQFVNGFDWHGSEIFENDIMQDDKGSKWKVEYNDQNCAYILRNIESNKIREFISLPAMGSNKGVYFGFEIIGNINDKN